MNRIDIGGLMRCCIATANEREQSQVTSSEGDVLPCKYCTSSMILRDGAWRWNKHNEGT